MERRLFVITLALASGCGKAPSTTVPTTAESQETEAARRAEMDDFLVKWLEGHGHADVVVDSGGVGVAGNDTRLRAGLYGSESVKGGFVVEVEFTIQLPSRRKITEFVAGTGQTEEQAIKDALLNFLLTTFHVVYKAFINEADPHMTASTVAINSVNREVISGDIFMRGDASNEDIDLHPLRPEIQGALQRVPLTPGPHWIKIVYMQQARQPVTVAVTLDNAEHPGLTEAVKRLNWPARDEFYMAKQFIVVK
jgi:hypothetical protein